MVPSSTCTLVRDDSLGSSFSERHSTWELSNGSQLNSLIEKRVLGRMLTVDPFSKSKTTLPLASVSIVAPAAIFASCLSRVLAPESSHALPSTFTAQMDPDERAKPVAAGSAINAASRQAKIGVRRGAIR